MTLNQNSISAAAFIFERENGNQLGSYEQEVIESSEIQDLQEDAIQSLLVQLIENGIEHNGNLTSIAIWALGKRNHPSNISFFDSVLSSVLESNNNAAYQAMIALDNLGVSIFENCTSVSMNDTESNYILGKKYLESKNA